MYRVEAVVFDKSDGGKPRPSSGAFTTQVQVAPDGRYHCFACGHDGRTEPTGGLNYCEQCGAEVTN